jgi:hypothetical protein
VKSETTKGHLTVSGFLITFFEGLIQYFFQGDSLSDLRMLFATIAPAIATCMGFFSYRLYISNSLPEVTLEKLNALKKGERHLKKQINCIHITDKDRETLRAQLFELYTAQTQLLSGK